MPAEMPGPSPQERGEKPKPELSESLAKDPQYGAISTELVMNWERQNGIRYDKNGVLRAEFQDFLFGNPADLKRGERPVTLDDRVKEAFRERFPQESAAYEEMERQKIYGNPLSDPAIRETETEITRRTNIDPQVKETLVEQDQRGYQEAWESAQRRIAQEEWNRFVDSFPQKAAAYRERNEVPLKVIYEGRERLQQHLKEPSP